MNGDWKIIRRAGMKTHRDLDVWKLAINYAKYIYLITRHFPKEELYGLVSQMCRAVVSISTSISEGAARRSRKELKQFLYIARASAVELETLLEISKRTNMTSSDNIEIAKRQNESLITMLSALIKRLNTIPIN
ncbi:MAG: four helix bundle protein [Gammaproteobacteria bacterium]